MKLHRNAALSWNGRRQLAERVVVQGWSVAGAAEAAGVSVRCARKWIGRYRAAGEAGLVDRSSAPATVANRTDPERIAVIAKLRALRMTAAEIAETLAMPLSTVSGILTRIGMGRLGRLGLEPAVRYERARPGELVHVDVKKLGRIPAGGGWFAHGRSARPSTNRSRPGYEFVHCAIDDHTRLAYAEIHPDERTETCAGFLRRAAAWFADHGIDRIEAVMTDNALAYRNGRAWQQALTDLGATATFTRRYRPQTNGKAERFNRTLLEEWAYSQPFTSSSHRADALPTWLHTYNHHRTHTAIGGQPPINRVNDLAGHYS